MFATGVATGVGCTVLMLPQARPRRPSPALVVNCCERVSASSMAWFCTVKPPMVMLSVPTVPDAEDWSPYWICHVLPDDSLKVEDFEGSKMW